MKNQNCEKLVRRIKADSIISAVIAAGMGVYSVLCTAMAARTLVKDPSTPMEIIGNVSLISAAVTTVIVTVLFVLLACMLGDIRRTGKPFTRRNVNRMVAGAFVSIAAGVIPTAIKAVGSLMADNSVRLAINGDLLVFCGFGVVLGIISEVFRYGCDIEEDIDSIA